MSFGQEIRQARELREIQLREVSETTKISLRYLEALERNDFDELPGGVFNRGFVRAYAEYIGVDVEDMVNAYLAEEQSRSGPRSDGARGLLRGQQVTSRKTVARADTTITPQVIRRRRILLLIAAVAAVGALAAAVWILGIRGRSEAGIDETARDPALSREQAATTGATPDETATDGDVERVR